MVGTSNLGSWNGHWLDAAGERAFNAHVDQLIRRISPQRVGMLPSSTALKLHELWKGSSLQHAELIQQRRSVSLSLHLLLLLLQSNQTQFGLNQFYWRTSQYSIHLSIHPSYLIRSILYLSCILPSRSDVCPKFHWGCTSWRFSLGMFRVYLGLAYGLLQDLQGWFAGCYACSGSVKGFDGSFSGRFLFLSEYSRNLRFTVFRTSRVDLVYVQLSFKLGRFVSVWLGAAWCGALVSNRCSRSPTWNSMGFGQRSAP